METSSVFEDKFLNIIKETDVKSILLENTEEEAVETPQEKPLESQNIINRSCSYCRVHFADTSVQREHYKLDWHRFNLKQSLQGKNPITESEFELKNGNDDISSISGSDSEKEDTLDTYAIAQGKIYLQNTNGQIFSLYKCLLFNKKDEMFENEIAVTLRNICIYQKQWAILMLGGGHFAGAVFQNGKPILHKTCHYYTVRQGQGGSQYSKDNKGAAKSAGASLRRYNEQSYIQHVQEILEQWKIELGRCGRIFCRAAGPFNKAILFGGKNPPLQKSDHTLRTIPFPTRRATFTEINRVYNLLATAQIFENLESAVQHLDKRRPQNRDTKRTKTRSPQINRAKSREITERPLPTKHSSETNSLANSDSETEEEIEKNIPTNLELDNFKENKTSSSTKSELDLENIEQKEPYQTFKYFEDYDLSVIDKNIDKNKVFKKKKPKKSAHRIFVDQDSERKMETKKLVAAGNLEKLKEMFKSIDSATESATADEVKEKKVNFINEVLDYEGNTLLHVAAMNGQVEVVQFLLENDASPCVKNKKQVLPFLCAVGKPVKATMKDFARENPKMHDYKEARIPVDTLTPDQLAEKKKQQKQVKREKEKQKKEELRLKKLEEVEKERFTKLSDREKRALAAERRILSKDGKVISRCFLCASDMSGKVPFEYLKNRFCSMNCLKAHRMQNSTLLS